MNESEREDVEERHYGGTMEKKAIHSSAVRPGPGVFSPH